jgi:heat shock factor-binding protein 1
MLGQMQQRFGEMNTNIVGRIDEMGRKIDELEISISELVQEAQVDPAV